MPEIEAALKQNVRVFLVTGDADFICSWRGTEAVADALEWPGQELFVETELQPYYVGEEEKGLFKMTRNLGLVRVERAGHNVPWYRKYVRIHRSPE